MIHGTQLQLQSMISSNTSFTIDEAKKRELKSFKIIQSLLDESLVDLYGLCCEVELGRLARSNAISSLEIASN